MEAKTYKQAPYRKVKQKVPARQTHEGAGFLVHRPFPTHALSHFDPFLLLDEMGPVSTAPGEAKGAPDHPHRGFETVTYLLSGEMEHRDSAGHAGRLGPGDVQWMTAGSGVIHSELPSAAFQATGGRLHGFQLWVNLPRKDKMMAPRYQEVKAVDLPVVTLPEGKGEARLLAGSLFGHHAVIDTRTPILYFDVQLQPGNTLSVPVPTDFEVFAYVVGGGGQFGEEGIAASAHEMVLFGAGAGDVLVDTRKASTGARFLLIGGKPLREPIARYGPFVMNTRQEIEEAIIDFQTGRFLKQEVSHVHSDRSSRKP